MAEFLWRVRNRAAAAALLIGAGCLALLDHFARPGEPARSLAVMASGLILAGAGALLVPWESKTAEVRLVPAAITLLGLGAAIQFGDLASTPYAPIGLTILAIMMLVYVGFVSSPGWALALSPLVLVVLVFAHQRQPGRISLALPLVAVPAAAVLAELVSLMGHRLTKAATQSRRRLDRLTQLESVLRRFRRPGTLSQAALQVAVSATEIFGVERATVVLADPAGSLTPVSVGPTSDTEPDQRTAALVVAAINGDEPQLVASGSNGTMLILPLPAEGAPAGAVLLYPVPVDDPEFTLDLARLFGVQVGNNIEHLFVIDELSRATTRDALTGIGNRRHADALLASLKGGDALVLLDLDFLKTVNDTLGHAAGDQVLQELSAHLRTVLRDSDTSARLGGDEFLVVARRAHADPLAVANRILAGWQGKGGMTTISAGVALHEEGSTSADTFDRADSALYRAKAAGKAQAKLWSKDSDDQDRSTPSDSTR